MNDAFKIDAENAGFNPVMTHYLHGGVECFRHASTARYLGSKQAKAAKPVLVSGASAN